MTGRHVPTRRSALIAAALALLALGGSGGSAGAATFTPFVAPTVDFTVSPAHPRVGDQVTFTSAATDSAGTITTESWTFGDGGSATGHKVTHTYGSSGDKSVTLTVTNDLLETGSQAKTVTVVPNQPPVASFTFTPAAPTPGQKITFHSTSTDPDGTVAAFAWDLNDDGVFSAGEGTTPNVSRSFPTAGPHTVHLRVTDDLGATDAAATNVVVNQPPTATFTFKPANPIEGDTVGFTSTAADTDGTIATQQWDLNGDGAYDDATGAAASRKFGVPGTNPVGLRVTDNRGAVTTTTANVVVVANKAPTAVFSFTPATPAAGDTVTLTSASKDADGTITKSEWDLDGDGQFDDATGATVKRAFDAGPHRVSLRVTDDRGATTSAFQTITVRDAPKPPVTGNSFTSPGPTAVPAPHVGPALMSPFPIVSLRGRLTRSGALIQALEVLQAPRGSRVEVRCRGRGCTFRKKIRSAAKPGRRVRFREVEHRLRAGALLQIFITKPGLVGKYTSFLIRKGTTPRRRDRCLMPGVRHPTRCSPS